MKTNVTISEITKDDLVDLFSTAFYANNRYRVYYEDLNGIERDEEDCFEDLLAKKVLNDGRICVVDLGDTEGAVYGDIPCKVEESEEYDGFVTTYYLTLDIIKRGLERAASGTFNAGQDEGLGVDFVDNNLTSATRAFYAFAYDYRDWDAIRADILMQIILFDEIVY